MEWVRFWWKRQLTRESKHIVCKSYKKNNKLENMWPSFSALLFVILAANRLFSNTLFKHELEKAWKRIYLSLLASHQFFMERFIISYKYIKQRFLSIFQRMKTSEFECSLELINVTSRISLHLPIISRICCRYFSGLD